MAQITRLSGRRGEGDRCTNHRVATVTSLPPAGRRRSCPGPVRAGVPTALWLCRGLRQLDSGGGLGCPRCVGRDAPSIGAGSAHGRGTVHGQIDAYDTRRGGGGGGEVGFPSSTAAGGSPE